MSVTGYIQVHSYASNALIPLKDVAVTITDASGSALAMRLTNRNGQFDQPFALAVPDLSASQSPDTGIIPYATVNLYARKKNYEEIYVKEIQVFANTVTEQKLELIPLAEFPERWIKTESFITSSQNL